jgi:hypothetical protein
MVVLVPVPVVNAPPGVRINVHVPLDGKPLSTTLPVDKVHVGCVTIPITGAVGVEGCAVMTTFADDTDIQLLSLVTVKELVPVERPEMVVLVPVPVVITAPGVRINLHVPLSGNPFNTTLPVPVEHVG